MGICVVRFQCHYEYTHRIYLWKKFELEIGNVKEPVIQINERNVYFSSSTVFLYIGIVLGINVKLTL